MSNVYYSWVQMKCNVCELEFDCREKFAGHMSGHVRRKEVEKRIKVESEHKCHSCNKVFKSGCSLGGHMQFHRKTFAELRSDGALKVRILEEIGHRCQICNLTKWMDAPIPIHLDHIDGNPLNQERVNLRLICPNCHAQTPTYCGKNIGRPMVKRRDKTNFPKYRSKGWIEEQITDVAE